MSDFWPRSYRDIATSIVATGTIVGFAWTNSTRVPRWAWLVVAFLFYLGHVVVLSRRLRKVEALKEKAESERDAALTEQRLLGLAVPKTGDPIVDLGNDLLSEPWTPGRSLIVEPWSGNDDFVQIRDDGVRVLCRVRFVNVSPYTITVEHGTLTWIVGTRSVNIARGNFREAVIDEQTKAELVLEPGEEKRVSIHNGDAKLENTVEACAALMTVSGYVNVRSRAWDGVKRLEFNEWTWISVADARKNPTKPPISSAVAASKLGGARASTEQGGAVVMHAPGDDADAEG